MSCLCHIMSVSPLFPRVGQMLRFECDVKVCRCSEATQARTEYFSRCLESGNYSSETGRHRQLSELGEGEGSFLS